VRTKRRIGFPHRLRKHIDQVQSLNRVLVVFKRRLSEEPAGNWLIILNRAQKVTLEDICASIVKDAALLERISPIHKLDRIKAPVMVIHGTRDPRVPIGEAKQVAEGLQKRGLPVQLMTFEDEGHGLAKRPNRLVAYPAMIKFLDEHVKRKGSTPAAP